MSLPIVGSPQIMQERPGRPVQLQIPPTRTERNPVSVRTPVHGSPMAPTLPLGELRQGAELLCDPFRFDSPNKELIAQIVDNAVNNNLWRDSLNGVWSSAHRTSVAGIRRLNLGGLRDEVDSWFEPAVLARLLGEPGTETERLGQEWLAEGGKRWRPFLTVALYQALLEQPQPFHELSDELRRVAVSLECFHKASLIHDDIEDDDAERYGGKTMHERHGVPVALNLGDFLIGEGYRLLAESDLPADRRAEMLRLAAAGHRSLSIGQGEELLWTRAPKPMSPQEVMAIFRGKTAPAFSTALHIGAVLGGADEAMHRALDAFSDALGVAYQIRDDLDDLQAAREAGEAPEVRPTLPWAIAYQTADKARRAAVAQAWLHGGNAEQIHQLLDTLQVQGRSAALYRAYMDEAILSLRGLDNANVRSLLRRVVSKIFDEPEIGQSCSKPGQLRAPMD